jgi:hypothetical protein
MYLRDLAVFSSKFRPSDELTALFDVSTHIVVEPVLAWIPRNKVVLDQLAKLNVEAGDPEAPGSRYEKWQGVGTYYVPDFDFERYSLSSVSEQADVILSLLTEAFGYVADRSGSDASLCFEAVRKVRESGLPLPRLNSQEFWAALPASKRRSKSFREHIEFSARIVDRDQPAQQTAARDRVKKRGA